jgi:hypothetical protein
MAQDATTCMLCWDGWRGEARGRSRFAHIHIQPSCTNTSNSFYSSTSVRCTFDWFKISHEYLLCRDVVCLQHTCTVVTVPSVSLEICTPNANAGKIDAK